VRSLRTRCAAGGLDSPCGGWPWPWAAPACLPGRVLWSLTPLHPVKPVAWG